MFVFELPEIGEGVVEGEIVRWLIAEGDSIRVDQPLCEVMTDKATVEISSPRAGRIARLHGREGDVVKVHSPLVDIDESDAGKAASVDNGAAKGAAPSHGPGFAPETPSPTTAPATTPASPRGAEAERALEPARTGGKTLATPAVRSFARSLDVPLEEVAGTGKGGRITRQDVERAANPEPAHAEPAHADAIKAPPALHVPPALPGMQRQDETIRLIGLRRKIAEQMTRSYRTVPHFTYVDEVDATELIALRQRLKPLAEARGVKLSYLPFIMKALVQVFREFPMVNAVMDEEAFELTARGEVNIGVATDTPAGLYVPVVKNVERRSILELAQAVEDVTERTRAGKAKLEDLQGGTFTITSVGNIGGRFATPIINHPEVAILGVNQIHERPVVREGAIVARQMMYLSPSFDHRVLDGAVAARFVSALKEVLENPQSLLLELR